MDRPLIRIGRVEELVTDENLEQGLALMPRSRRERILRYGHPEDRKRSLAVTLLLLQGLVDLHILPDRDAGKALRMEIS